MIEHLLIIIAHSQDKVQRLPKLDPSWVQNDEIDKLGFLHKFSIGEPMKTQSFLPKGYMGVVDLPVTPEL